MSYTQTVAWLNSFEHDVNISATDKQKVLKMLHTILHNLLTKGADNEKFRQLRRSNPKIKSLTAHPPIHQILTQTAGFADSADDTWTAPAVTTTLTLAVVSAVQAAHTRVVALVPPPSSSTTSKLTERQKARQLAEQQAEKEKLLAKAARKRTADQIKADKYVRENDPNWKPSVNAAAAKAGSSISTFRDKFGE